MAKCDYCGQENAVDASHCTGCGKVLEVELPKAPVKKSKTIAVVLAILLGPLGLLYLGGEGLVAVLFVAGVSLFVLPILTGVPELRHFSLLIALLARVACVSYALKACQEPRDAEWEAEAEALLDEAIQLENVDMALTLTKYEEVISHFPNSKASQAATICIKTLKRNLNHP